MKWMKRGGFTIYNIDGSNDLLEWKIYSSFTLREIHTTDRESATSLRQIQVCAVHDGYRGTVSLYRDILWADIKLLGKVNESIV